MAPLLFIFNDRKSFQRHFELCPSRPIFMHQMDIYAFNICLLQIAVPLVENQDAQTKVSSDNVSEK